MNKMKIALLVVIMTLLANCTSQSPVVTDIATSQETNTLTPDIKPSETATPMLHLTNTLTFTPTVTWTPLPTLSAEGAQARIKELLETNGGCELPCWWGIVPNKTTWEETLHRLSPFMSDVKQGSTERVILNGKPHSFTNINIYYKSQEDQETEIWFTVLDSVVLDITVFPLSTQYKYQLHQILSLLGIPEQIFISAQQSAPYPILPPTVLILDYSDDGVWASYGYIPSLVGENLVICPEPVASKVSIYDNVGGRLELFDPEMENDLALSFEEYADMVGGFTAKKLEDVTNMSIETFYNTFVDPQPKTCLETPANLWP
jgi:hypothetical protein